MKIDICKPAGRPSGLLTKTMRIMKLSLVFLLVAITQIQAKTFSQITISGNDLSLKRVFREIRKQTGYSFWYEDGLVKDGAKVDIDVKNAPLDLALKAALKSQGLQYELIGNTVVLKAETRISENTKPPSEKDGIERRGRVVDESGNPIEGVTVSVRGTNIATATNGAGEFVLPDVEPGAVLVFTSRGYATKTLNVSGTNGSINVTLQIEVKDLSDVVVTALGISREKKSVGFSSQELGPKDLSEVRDVSVANYFTGKVAGAQISRTASGTGGSTKVIIRGISSLTGENQPLYVVDGVPIDNSRFREASDGSGNRNASAGHDFGDGISNLNPQDIASVTVLKGPNATALYGSRGSNGVILITTKSGTAGKKFGVDVSSGTTLERVSMIPKVQNTYGPGYDDEASQFDTPIEIGGVSYGTLPLDVSSFGQRMVGQEVINPYVIDETAPPVTFKLLPQPENNIKDFWETGLFTSNSLAFYGGTEKSSARLSVNNTTTKGITPNHTGTQQNVNLRVGTKVNDRLSFDAKVNYIHRIINNTPNIGAGFENVLWALTELNRYVPLDFLKAYHESGGTRVRFPGVRYNPYYIINELKNKAVRDRVIGLASVKYQFNNWLSMLARTGIDNYSERRRQTWPVGAQTAQSSGGRIIDETYSVFESNSDVLLTANSNLGKDFTFSLSAGGALLKRNTRVQGWDANTFKVPGIYDVSNAQNIVPSYSHIPKEMQSVYGFGQIGFRNYAFIDVTGRNDWSSTLGRDNYSFFYPSVSGSFVFTEAFNVDPRMLSFGKIRASFAQAGNDAAAFLTESGYFLNSIAYNGQSYASQDTKIALFDLKNELKKSIEFGADLRFANNRAGIDITWYKSNTKNQIVPINISTGSGYTSKIINAGNIQNQGVEISLNAVPVDLQNGFRWDINFNVARNKSRVLELAPDVEALLLYSGFPNSIEARSGSEYGNIIGYKYKRSPDGRRIVGSDGSYLKENDVSVLGNVMPDWVGGINNTFSFKNFTLSALIDFVEGNEITSFTKYALTKTGTAKFTEEGRENSRPLDGVVEVTDGNGNVTKYEENTKTISGLNYWARRAYDNIGEEFVMDGSYWMLREVILGYSFQPSLLKNTPIKGLRISLVGRNLFFIRDHMQGTGISPETNLNTQAAATGLETLSMPTTRNYGFNLNISF
ncbi:MAG: SusC/RagA family TonB-linked outer membrane protein [Chitinophagaceae bacterium]|nr:SusC/RagA family TonB-linked outer membrane protein [Chitinophagaceae bacterium]